MQYLRNPDAIYARSFAIIREEAPIDRLTEPVQPIAVRLIHACGMTDVLNDLRVANDLPDAVRGAIATGRSVLADCEMVKSAVIRRNLPKNNEVVCTLNNQRAAQIGRERSITRSAAAVSLWRDQLDGAVVIIGNAPTALFALLEMVDAGADKPAAIFALPVGFVGAADSKQELHDNPRGIPYATILGRRGGSAMAAAAFNAVFAKQRQ